MAQHAGDISDAQAVHDAAIANGQYRNALRADGQAGRRDIHHPALVRAAHCPHQRHLVPLSNRVVLV